MHEAADEQWIAHCIAQVLAVDPVAEVSLLTPILEEMAADPRWRDQDPEVVIDKMLGPVRQIGNDDPHDTEWELPPRISPPVPCDAAVPAG